ncbi:hypothetical protein SCUP234_11626 [Seiridium cupressi]
MCPPGVDQTTRTSPRWAILCPQTKQKHKLEYRARPYIKAEGPVNFLLDGVSWGAFDKLAQPAANALGLSQLPERPRQAASVASFLEKLPPELIDMVISHLDASEKMAVSLASQKLWCHVMHYMQREYRADYLGSWAGKIILCTGTWLLELPPSMLDMLPPVRKQTLDRRGYGYGMAPARRWNWNSYGSYTEVTATESKIIEAFQGQLSSSHISTAEHPRLEAELRAAVFGRGLFVVEDGSSWLLRNLDTREIIYFKATRGDDSADNFLSVRGHPWLTLDFALLMRICWQPRSSSFGGDGLEGGFPRGPWAGHRFDVLMAEALPRDASWEDVTEGLIVEGEKIMKLKSVWYSRPALIGVPRGLQDMQPA